ncbi:MAG: hypothetical protein J5951_08600 [Bacteroidales bacterium]|nr:hypothetical protein [Bacteroidales bacterium]
MKTLSVGTRLFLSIMAIFVALVIVFVAYLRFDESLSTVIRDDAIFIWFAIGLAVLLVVVLLLYSHKMDSSLARAASEENAQMRRQLTQNISHELKTPVASIQGYLETILANPEMPVETKRKFLERSLAQTQRLTTLLRDIAALNRLDEATRKEGKSFNNQAALLYPFGRIDIAQTLAQLQRETALAFQTRNMSLVYNTPETIDINGNGNVIYSIFRNLIDNALAYAGNGTTVTVTAHLEGTHWHFTVADNGPGVPAQHLKRIFERFYRIDKGRSRASGGTGLGLSIVKNAVILHGGTITASNANPGLRYDFTLHR